MCSPFLLWKIMWRKYVVAIIVILLNHGTKNQTKGIAMDNRRWVIALDKRTGRRVEFAMCDLNNVAFYQSKYTLSGYDVKVLTADEVEKFADDEKQNGIM